MHADREALEEWFEENDTSPKTGVEVAHKNHTPNVVLSLNIDDWKRKSGFIQKGATLAHEQLPPALMSEQSHRHASVFFIAHARHFPSCTKFWLPPLLMFC